MASRNYHKNRTKKRKAAQKEAHRIERMRRELADCVPFSTASVARGAAGRT